jgi:hypothetical protein
MLLARSQQWGIVMNRLELFVFLLLGVSATAATAQQARHHRPPSQGIGQWQVIGYKVVNGASDTDNIYMPGRQRVRQLRLCAFHAPLRLRDFDVYFANGARQDVKMRERVSPGTCSRAIDLQGRARDVTRIRLKYGRIQRGSRAPLVRVSAR